MPLSETETGRPGYFYFENEPGRRAAANLLTKDKASRIAAKIAKLQGRTVRPDDDDCATPMFSTSNAFLKSAIALELPFRAMTLGVIRP